jgi:hypothetical protein
MIETAEHNQVGLKLQAIAHAVCSNSHRANLAHIKNLGNVRKEFDGEEGDAATEAEPLQPVDRDDLMQKLDEVSQALHSRRKDDDAKPKKAPEPSMSDEDRQAAAAEMPKHLYKGFVSGPFLESLERMLQVMNEYCVVHSRRQPVRARPKLVYAIANPENQHEFPLYDWGQHSEYHGTLDSMPAELQPLVDMVKQKFPHSEAPNHMMITFAANGKSNYIPAHMDAGFSIGAGKYEDKTPIYVFSFLASRTFMVLDPAAPVSVSKKVLKPHCIYQFDFEHGDLFVLPPPWNSQVKHAVPKEEDVDGLRVSVVLRCCNARWVNLKTGSYTDKIGNIRFIKNDKDKQGNSKAPSQ